MIEIKSEEGPLFVVEDLSETTNWKFATYTHKHGIGNGCHIRTYSIAEATRLRDWLSEQIQLQQSKENIMESIISDLQKDVSLNGNSHFICGDITSQHLLISIQSLISELEKLKSEGQRDLDMILDLCSLIPHNDSGESPAKQMDRAKRFIKEVLTVVRESGVYEVQMSEDQEPTYARWNNEEKYWALFGNPHRFDDSIFYYINPTKE